MALPVINNPCLEKWEGMTPVEQGRFCGKCSKLVIDFTKKTTQEILDFLSARTGEDICGKLSVKPVFAPVKNRTRIFSGALLLVFGSLLFSACGSTEPAEEPFGKVGVDSATEAQNRHEFDSITKAKAEAFQPGDSSNQTAVLDSTKIANTMKVLDSIGNLKKQ